MHNKGQQAPFHLSVLAGEALATLVVNKLRGIISVCAIKAPGFGERRKSLLQDIAIVTGSEFLAKDLSMRVDEATVEQLGVARKVGTWGAVGRKIRMKFPKQDPGALPDSRWMIWAGSPFSLEAFRAPDT